MPRMPNISRERKDLTPFAALLDNWLWQNHTTAGQLAIKLGLSYNSVWYWLKHGVIPRMDTLVKLAEVTGIPLGAIYESLNIPIPSVAEPQPSLNELLAAEWEKMIADVVAVMRADGVGEPAIQQVVAHIRDRQFGTHRERHVLAEFAPPPPERVVDGEIADQPTQIIERPKTPAKPRSTNRSTTRRRETAPPRRSR